MADQFPMIVYGDQECIAYDVGAGILADDVAALPEALAPVDSYLITSESLEIILAGATIRVWNRHIVHVNT